MSDATRRPSVAISIVSHNQLYLVLDLLRDIEKILVVQPHDEIILTINSDENLSELDNFTNLPVRVIKNLCQRGFGQNHNIAFSTSSSELFLVLNPDVRNPVLESKVFQTLIDRKSIGIWAPKVISPTGLVEDSARLYPSPYRIIIKALRLSLCRGKNLESSNIQVEWVAGIYMLMRRGVFESVGGFDERYFMYVEDADLCRRVASLDYHIVYDPNYQIVHAAQRTSRRSFRYFIWHVLSLMRFWVKYYFRNYFILFL